MQSEKPESAAVTEWTDDMNARRFELIDREVEGTLTEDETQELANLTSVMRKHVDRVAPVRVEGAKQLLEGLLREGK